MHLNNTLQGVQWYPDWNSPSILSVQDDSMRNISEVIPSMLKDFSKDAILNNLLHVQLC